MFFITRANQWLLINQLQHTQTIPFALPHLAQISLLQLLISLPLWMSRLHCHQHHHHQHYHHQQHRRNRLSLCSHTSRSIGMGCFSGASMLEIGVDRVSFFLPKSSLLSLSFSPLRLSSRKMLLTKISPLKLAS